MNNVFRKQKGNIFVVIVIILSLFIIGLLGFIFWQSFINKEVATTKKQDTVKSEPRKEVVEKNKVYQGEGYSFQYPATGWNLEVTPYEDPADDVALKTDNYKAIGMGVDAGSIIGVYEYTGGQSLDEQMSSVQKFSGSQDIKKTTVNGIPAFTYNSGYEGVRYHTIIVVSNKLTYDIVYRFEDNGDVATYMSGYNLVVSTFKLGS